MWNQVQLKEEFDSQIKISIIYFIHGIMWLLYNDK